MVTENPVREGDTVHPHATEYDGWVEHYATVKGMQIYYECENCEPPSGDVALLLVHGWTANRFRLHPLYIHLRDQKWPVFRMDLPGHAWSQKEGLEDFSIGMLADSVDAFIQQVMIAQFGFKRIILVGHSMGGVICQSVAIRQPPYLVGLLLLSTAACLFDNLGRRIGAKFTISGWKKDFDKMFGKKLKEHQRLGIQHFPEWGDKYRTKGRNLLPSPLAAWKTIDSMLHTDLRSQINKINVPTLIITGGKDILAPSRFSQFMHSQIASSEIQIVPGGQHNLSQHMPVSQNRIITAFLEKNYRKK